MSLRCRLFSPAWSRARVVACLVFLAALFITLPTSPAAFGELRKVIIGILANKGVQWESSIFSDQQQFIRGNGGPLRICG